jgi:hypothetical protein
MLDGSASDATVSARARSSTRVELLKTISETEDELKDETKIGNYIELLSTREWLEDEI